MSFESAQAWLAEHAPDLRLIDHGVSTATVREAAAALGVEEARIAKTLALRFGDRIVLLLAAGDVRLDNAKAKAAFGARPRMLPPDETLAVTGHQVGGVCPFGLATPLPIYCDLSLKPYPAVFPAAGSLTSSVEVAPDRLATLIGAEWVDVCSRRAADAATPAAPPPTPLP
ncbi:YbaK/EbsC family protein [Sphingomonas sp. MAH-20]|uniref:YbaK/EbsC family protein n=1 Tax=Sphingomonas horti TaxID=2682842 RepID=A0A6I4J2U7_9SPHN|nr:MULTISPECIES: YbaK/EbsC family protein [Sphingomonas]MBA2918724.1 YbaK/EbsC family protein [Sphingomonas sp. CGMCC 1.13658]MVO78755.1 YbaK/EbsC family protein [Sphingomonas horti]